MRRQAILLLTAMAVALILASGVALAASQLDQQQTSSNGETLIDGSVDVGQTFIAGLTGQVDKVLVYVGCCKDGSGTTGGTPPGDGIVVSVQPIDDATGLPTWKSLGSGSVPAENFTTDGSLGWVDVALNPAPGVEAGKQYALVMSIGGYTGASVSGADMSSATNASGYQWGYTTPSAYSGGTKVNIPFLCYEGYCEPQPERDDALDMAFKTFVGPDVTPPNTFISGPSGPISDNTPTFNFSGFDNLSASTNLLYSYKVDNGGWSSYSSDTSVTLEVASKLSDGAHTFYVKAKDEAGNEDANPAELSLTVDTAVPAGSVLINNDAARTRNRLVTLKLSASDPSPGSGVTHMRISNSEGGLSSAAWEPYATSKSWRLSSGQGMKTVYIQYKDAAGNISAVAQDSIRYRR